MSATARFLDLRWDISSGCWAEINSSDGGGNQMNEALGVALYKYLNYEGAKKTLENRTLKLSSPSVFNDPFDMQLEEALGLEITEFAKTLGPALFDFLSGDIDYAQVR